MAHVGVTIVMRFCAGARRVCDCLKSWAVYLRIALGIAATTALVSCDSGDVAAVTPYERTREMCLTTLLRLPNIGAEVHRYRPGVSLPR